MSACQHTFIIKRPESGPGAQEPGEWFCLDCDAWWEQLPQEDQK